MNVGFYLLSKLLFQSFPGKSDVVHLQRARQLQSGETLQTAQTSHVTSYTDTLRQQPWYKILVFEFL